MYYFLSLAFSLNQLKTLNHMKTSLSGRFPRKALYKIYVFCVYVGISSDEDYTDQSVREWSLGSPYKMFVFVVCIINLRW